VAQLHQLAPPMMRRRASLHADQARAQSGKEPQPGASACASQPVLPHQPRGRGTRAWPDPSRSW
jgi:hypothetical protein